MQRIVNSSHIVHNTLRDTMLPSRVCAWLHKLAERWYKPYLEDESANESVTQALVQGWDVHVSHQARECSVHKLSHEQLEREAPLLCTLCVVPAQTISKPSKQTTLSNSR